MSVTPDPGSFKDPEGRVLLHDGKVFRTLSDGALQRMRSLAEEGVFDSLSDKGLLIQSKLVHAKDAGLAPEEFGETVLQHEPVPVIGYPFEWSFDMLCDAALCTLDLLEACLDRGLILKDATAYNVVLSKDAWFSSIPFQLRFIGTGCRGRDIRSSVGNFFSRSC